jgi:SAM-dependent methyltransferase
MSLRTVARGLIRGVSWKNPVVSVMVHAVDPVDSVARRIHGRSHLPPYSVRSRSVGIRPDIGAGEFVRDGMTIGGLLRKHAGLTPDSRTLEIGCGCGRNAFALAGFLHDGNYTGMDVERVALEGARNNPLLRQKRFSFDFLDVRNDAYNPHGRFLAEEYVLPYADASFDVVFMNSVFTHMLTAEVCNYVRQIARVLRPGGRCYLTAYLLDGRGHGEFPFHADQHSYANQALPGIAVAYESAFLVSTFAASGMKPTANPVLGNAHGAAMRRDQDILVFAKER